MSCGASARSVTGGWLAIRADLVGRLERVTALECGAARGALILRIDRPHLNGLLRWRAAVASCEREADDGEGWNDELLHDGLLEADETSFVGAGQVCPETATREMRS